MGYEDYKEWHLNLGHSEYRITITMAGYGSDMEAAEDFLEAFHEKCPEASPVVSTNSEADTISVTVAVHAKSSEHAQQLAAVIWQTGGEASGLIPGDVVNIEIEPVSEARDHETEQERVTA